MPLTQAYRQHNIGESHRILAILSWILAYVWQFYARQAAPGLTTLQSTCPMEERLDL